MKHPKNFKSSLEPLPYQPPFGIRLISQAISEEISFKIAVRLGRSDLGHHYILIEVDIYFNKDIVAYDRPSEVTANFKF